MQDLTTSIQQCTENFSQKNKTRKRVKYIKIFEVWQTLLVAGPIALPPPSMLLEFASLQRGNKHHTCIFPASLEVREHLLRDSLEGSLPSFLSFQLLFKQHFSGFLFFQLSGAISIVKHSFGHYDIDLTYYASLTSLPLSPFWLIFSLSLS